jgi:transcription elongation factor Elf1
MSGPELEIVEVKSEPLLQEANIQNEGQHCPPNSPIESALANAKEARRKTKKSALAGTFPCLICNKEYMYETFLTRHMVSKHRACEPIHQYRCKHCGAIFADEAGFEKHKSLFFDFLRHHLERVRPMELQQENEVSEFEQFFHATAENGQGENGEGLPAVKETSGEAEVSSTTNEAEEFLDSLLGEFGGPTEKKPRIEPESSGADDY